MPSAPRRAWSHIGVALVVVVLCASGIVGANGAVVHPSRRTLLADLRGDDAGLAPGRSAGAQHLGAALAPAPAPEGNSSPAPEPLSPIDRIPTATPPIATAFDPRNGWLYVTREDFAGVTVYQGHTVVASLPMGWDPGPLAYDPVNGLVYVVNVCGGVYSGGCNATHPPNGTVSVVNNTTLQGSVTVGPDPVAIAVDPGSGVVYVVARNASFLSLLNGTQLSATYSIPDGADAAALDAASDTLYVADPGIGEILLFDSRGETGEIADAERPVALVYDGSDQLVCAADAGLPSLDCFSGTRSVSEEAIPLTTSTGLFYDPGNRLVYVTGSGPAGAGETFATYATSPGTPFDPATPWSQGFTSGLYLAGSWHVLLTNFTGSPSAPGAPSLTVYDTLLAIAPLRSVTNGTVAGDVDVGADLGLSTSMVSTGTGTIDGVPVTTIPASGLVCSADRPAPGLPNATVMGSCRAYAAGSYLVTLSATDSSGTAVSAWTTVDVAPDPTVSPPGITLNNATYSGESAGPLPGPDAGQPVQLQALVSGGSGPFAYDWQGLAGENCTGGEGPAPVCAFAGPGLYRVSLEVRDLGGAWNASGSSSYIVVATDPVVSPPSFGPSSLPVGQSVVGTVAETGGVPPVEFRWVGLPPGCPETGVQISCAPNAAGTYHVHVRASDGNGFLANSSTVLLTVLPATGFAALGAWAWVAGAAALVAVGALGIGLAVRRTTSTPRRAPRARSRSLVVYASHDRTIEGPVEWRGPVSGPEPWSESEPEGEAPGWE